MPLRKHKERIGDRVLFPDLGLLARPVSELLVSGGDGRLKASGPGQRNAYGCTPYPPPGLPGFGSSTASSISLCAFARVQAAQLRMCRDAVRFGGEEALDQRMEELRGRLRQLWRVPGAEIVFSPSGTDAQLQALFLAKALLGGPLATIIVGADQTGSGTVHTARGFHFSDGTSLGHAVDKAFPIAGLSENIRTSGIDFCDENGQLRSDQDMDRAVHEAVADAIRRGEKVLLQAMASSKLGWSGPSEHCLAAISAAWPRQVCIVIDACQMRLAPAQLGDYLARGYLVLATGSKFFTGPPFSGALLVPQEKAEAIDSIAMEPGGFSDYATRPDWPRRWHALRMGFPATPNLGQWLRWEAALAEMEDWFAVPQTFRGALLQGFAAAMPQLIGSFADLMLLDEQCGVIDTGRNDEMRHRTIFSFVPQKNGRPMPPEDVAALYRALGDGQLGQPVPLRHGAALRLSASARMVSEAWARNGNIGTALALVLADARAVLEQLDGLIARPDSSESQLQCV